MNDLGGEGEIYRVSLSDLSILEAVDLARTLKKKCKSLGKDVEVDSTKVIPENGVIVKSRG